MSPARPYTIASGAWVPADPEAAARPEESGAAFQAALGRLDEPLIVVEHEGRPAVARGGRAHLGATSLDGALPLLAYVPPLLPGDLGDPTFLADHRVAAAYVAGEMANGIASEELVIAVARAGFLGIFGAAGLTVERVDAAMRRLADMLGDAPWGVNLIHSPDDPRLEASLVDLFLARRPHLVSASAYLDLTLSVVRYRVTGIHRDETGKVVVPHRLMAKVSRVEVARRFLSPPPEGFLAELVATGAITAEQAELAQTIPMADDVTAEADSGGHTDNRPLVLLLPAIAALRDEVAEEYGYETRVRVGAAGGIATPASVASAFAMGAAYVVTGSINQATIEAATSNTVRQLLAEAAPTDVAMAPAADMFEMGVKVQVLTRGTLFAVRAARLYELYRAHDGVPALPTPVREELEKKYFRATLDEAWEGCRVFFAERDPGQLERAEREPRHKLALLFRAYLGQASKWANAGESDRTLDYQVWCGPSMGAFNDWVRGSFLEAWENRRAVVIAKNLLVGAAVLTRAAALRTQVGALPQGLDRVAPRPEKALDALTTRRAITAVRDRSDDEFVLTPSRRPEALASSRAAREPIAIVGMGAMFPDAPNLESFWRLVRTGHDAVVDIPESHWSLADYYDPDPRAPDKTYARRGAFLRPYPFDPTEFGIPPSILEATDTSQLLGLVVARMAMEDAGYTEGRAWDRSRAGVILGVTGTQELVISLGARLGHPKWKKALLDAGIDEALANDVVARIAESYVGWQESSFPGLLGNVVAGRIANRLDLGGTNCVIDAACASSLAAVHLAVLELSAGKSDLVLTGGVDCLNDIFMHMCFSKTPALSASGDVRPFSDAADGTLLGEGLGMVVLKRLSDAERDGDRVYARILGVGTSSDGRAKSVYAPLPSGQARALRAAYAEAGVRPRDITLLEAHGTGTKAGDLAEFEALRDVYREDSDDLGWCALGTVKSQLGHTKAAAGAAGMIRTALALHHKVLPPTLKVERPHPSMRLAESPFAVTGVAQPWTSREGEPRRAAVSSFGFGGSNFHLVMEESSPTRTDVAWDGSVEILALSADDARGLAASAEAFLGLAADDRPVALARLRETFDPRAPHRLLVVIIGDDMEASVRPALERLASASGTPFQLTSRGAAVHYGVGPADGSVAFVFPGQGAQYVGMLRELACMFPELLAAMEGAPDIAAAVYPLPTFEDLEASRRTAYLTRTDVAQPALGILSRGLLQVLSRFGVRPSLVAGHSFGELVALHASGSLTASGLDAASRERGLLMLGDGEDRGTMLAVLAPLADIEALIAEEHLDLVLANRNAPQQGVLSGTQAEIERATAICRARGMRVAPLSVGAAFHSSLVADAATAFRIALEGIEWREGALPVVANSTAEPYPQDASVARDTLAQQLARPVRWDEVVLRLYAMGARCFVEVGPKATLTGLVCAVLGDRPFVAAAIDAGSREGALFDLAHVLARVASVGHSVNLAAWGRGSASHRPARKAKMAVPLSGANYRSPMPAPRPALLRPAPMAVVPASTAMVRQVAPASASPAVADALRAQQEGLRALQAMQEQTARVHQLFLEGQLAAHQSLQALLGNAPSVGVRAEPARPAVMAAPLPAAASMAASPPSLPVAAPLPAPVPLPAPEAVAVVPLLLAVVAEATGYPVETLSLDMGMEADLGIDSIKRVEILSMLSKRVPGAPSVNPEKLGALRTLQDVATFIESARGSAPRPAPHANGVANGVSNGAASHRVDHRAILLEVVAQLTGYPIETLAIDMDMEADLGIDSIKRVEILSTLSKRIPGAPSVNPEKLSKLRTLEQVLRFASTGAAEATAVPLPPPTKPAPVASSAPATTSLHRRAVVAVAAPLASETPLSLPLGTIVIAGDDLALADALAARLRIMGRVVLVVATADAVTGPVAALLLLSSDEHAWTVRSEASLKRALGLARSFGPRLRAAAGERMQPEGLLVAISRRDGAFGLATHSPTWSPLQGGLAGLVKTAAHEWPEVRCRAIDVSALWSPDEAAVAIVQELAQPGPREVGLGPLGRTALALSPANAMPIAGRLPVHGVVLVTGGARGVTADAARALGRRTGVELVLLGRSPLPAVEAPWLSEATTEAAIKRACLEHAAAGDRPSPRALGEACQAILAAREIRATLRACEADGVRAVYRSVDVRDEGAVASAVAEARDSLGPIVGVVHGAGVVRDRRIEDKEDRDFDAVFDPKLAGLRSVLAATRTDDLRCLVLFASASGRFGRRGQSDYAVANQALVSIAQDEAARRPQCRVAALDWGPWDGGMVTPALRKEFEREGVPLIPRDKGAEAMVDEALSAPGGPVEVVLGAGFGSEAAADWTLAALWRLDAKTFSVLRDHALGGKSVLPLALTVEWMLGAALSATGRPVQALEDVRVFRGVSVGAAPTDVSVWVGPPTMTNGSRRDASTRVTVELRSADHVHVRAVAVVGVPASPPAPLDPPGLLRPPPVPVDRLYREQLFHGPALEAIHAIDGMSEAGMTLVLRAHPTSERLLPGPTATWQLDPLVLDGVFQALIVWCRAYLGAPSLPSSVGRLVVLGPIATPLVRATVRVTAVEGKVVTSDVDLLGSEGRVVARLEAFSCTASASLQRAFASEPLAGSPLPTA